ncbi:MAG TPA: hypothetical protein VGF86_03450 [Candidatus Tumulicola sp.]|jgi:hypothetical protein
MTKVFIAGSRSLSRLNADVKHRIDTMIDKGFTILVGDANGADKAVQRYLAEKHFRNVMVHCMAGNCRNNIAGWPTREIFAAPGSRGFAYYSTKDLAMANDAEYGFMLWDGESKGTLNSVINMVHQNKTVVVYFAPQKSFQNLRSPGDVTQLLANLDPAKVHSLERQLGIERQLA